MTIKYPAQNNSTHECNGSYPLDNGEGVLVQSMYLHTVELLNSPKVPRGTIVTLSMPIICSVEIIFPVMSTGGIKPLNSKMIKIDLMKI